MADEEKGQSLEDLVTKLQDAREGRRKAEAEAKQVPSLKAELERVTRAKDKLKDQLDEKVAENGDLEVRIRELESDKRAADDLDAKIGALERERDEAQELAGDRDAKLSEAQRHIDVLNQSRAELCAERDAALADTERLDHLIEIGVVRERAE